MIYQQMTFKVPIDLHQRLKLKVVAMPKGTTMASHIVALLEKDLAMKPKKEARNG